MFTLRFDWTGCPGGDYLVQSCDSYYVHPSHLELTLHDGGKSWQLTLKDNSVVYVMNERGATVDKIYSPLQSATVPKSARAS